jgi:GntR family transcriptional regulator
LSGDKKRGYLDLAENLRDAILRGRLGEGRQLPTEAELVESYGVSRQTVRRAFQDLVAEGMVYRVPGRGTFATPDDVRHLRQVGGFEDMVGLPASSELEVLTPLRTAMNVEAAGRLQLESDLVAYVSFRRLIGDKPFNVTEVYLPPAIGTLLESFPEISEMGRRSKITVIGLLEHRAGIQLSESVQSISAERASPAFAAQLGVQNGEVVMRTDRLYRSADRRAVELAISYSSPTLYSYRVRLRRNSAR